MKTTLKQIRAARPCGLTLQYGERVGYLKLQHYLGKARSDNTPVSIATIIDSNGIDDAIWCLSTVKGQDRVIRLFGVWCANQVRHLVTDKRSITALDVAERFANGLTTRAELDVARDAAWDATRAAALASAALASTARRNAAEAATWAAAWASGTAVATRVAQTNELRRVCACMDSGIDPYPNGTRGELPQPNTMEQNK